MKHEEAFHGGAFFEAIGVDLRHLERSSEVISADVLDAWFDPAPSVLALLRENLPFLLRTSPPNHAEGFVEEVARARGVPEESVLPGSGSSSLLFHCLPHVLAQGSPALMLEPMYSEYEHIVGHLLGGSAHVHSLKPGSGFLPDAERFLADVRRLRPAAVLLVNPNNPTGRLWGHEAVLEVLEALPEGTLAVIDETYLEYAAGAVSLEAEAARRRNLIVLKSMSKVYALSGARVAYLVTHPERAAALRPWLPPWPVGLLAQAAAMEALRQPEYYAARYRETAALRDEVSGLLAQVPGVRVCESDANFYLIETEQARERAAALRGQSIFVREFPAGPLAGRYLRVSVKDQAANRRIAAALADFASGAAQ